MPTRKVSKKASTKKTKARRGKSASKRGAKKHAAGGAGLAPAGFLLVNMIPKSLSGETNQDSEPHLTVNPANPNQIIGTAFSPNPGGGPFAPVYMSLDGGNTWALNPSCPARQPVLLALAISRRASIAVRLDFMLPSCDRVLGIWNSCAQARRLVQLPWPYCNQDPVPISHTHMPRRFRVGPAPVEMSYTSVKTISLRREVKRKQLINHSTPRVPRPHFLLSG